MGGEMRQQAISVGHPKNAMGGPAPVRRTARSILEKLINRLTNQRSGLGRRGRGNRWEWQQWSAILTRSHFAFAPSDAAAMPVNELALAAAVNEAIAAGHDRRPSILGFAYSLTKRECETHKKA